MDDASLLSYLWKGMVSVGGAALSFFTVRTINRLDKLEDEHDKSKDDLAAYKLHVSDTYAKEVTTQASLSRIHDRIDEVSADIKTLLGRAK